MVENFLPFQLFFSKFRIFGFLNGYTFSHLNFIFLFIPNRICNAFNSKNRSSFTFFILCNECVKLISNSRISEKVQLNLNCVSIPLRIIKISKRFCNPIKKTFTQHNFDMGDSSDLEFKVFTSKLKKSTLVSRFFTQNRLVPKKLKTIKIFFEHQICWRKCFIYIAAIVSLPLYFNFFPTLHQNIQQNHKFF